MKIIIFDFEVFYNDCLFGSIILNNNKKEIFQTWNLEEIKNFYLDNKDNSIWIGHNSQGYDSLILEAIVNGKNEKEIKELNDKIVNTDFKRYCNLKLYQWDLMKQSVIPYSLKSTELYDGKNISESQVDFNIKRDLTVVEKELTESYNRDDLEQTLNNFNEMSSKFKQRLDMLKEFNLPLDYLSVSGTKLAAIVLGAKKIDGIEYDLIKPKMYDTLELKNKKLVDYYLKEKFRTSEKLTITVGGVEQQIGSGGIHAAIPKYHTDKALYFDVSGYYNLIMINYDLLPRTLPPEAKAKYIYMYHEQLRLKKIDPVKRGVYKGILLSVFGAMMNEYTDFYDPQKGLLVTITGQLFAVDLMEKLEGIAKVIQSNTDGIIVEPYDWKDEQKVIEIVEEWEKRTGFVIKKEHIYNVWQRDVNCYCYVKDDKINTVGEAVRVYDKWKHPFDNYFFNIKEPIIFAYCVVDYLMNNILPEETIEKYKRDLQMFQFSCKKNSFDYTQIELCDIINNTIEVERLQGVNRVFPSKNKNIIGTIYKCRNEGKVKKAKVANLPTNVFIYDEDIKSEEAINKLVEEIDYNYYINRAYEKLLEFIKIKVVKDINL